jgi:hypothetical protein
VRIALRLAFIASVIALAAVASMLIPLDGSLTNVRVAGAANPIEIDATSLHGNQAISFGTDCNTEMAPGDNCTDLISVHNNGDSSSFSFTYTIAVWLDSNGIDDGAAGPAGDIAPDCFHINFKHGPVNGTDVGTGVAFGPASGAQLGLGQTEDWGLEVAVNDDNACQGHSAVIMGLVFATSVDNTPTPVPTGIPITIETPLPTVAIPTFTPVNQVRAATAVASPTRTTQTQGVVVVNNLPRTGQGSAHHGASPWLIGIGALLALLAATLLAANVAVEARNRR